MPHKQCGSPTAELERQCNPSIILLAAMRGGLKTKRETMARRVDRAAPADAAITGNTGAVDTKLGNRQLAVYADVCDIPTASVQGRPGRFIHVQLSSCIFILVWAFSLPAS
jgi:hypothetical protein